MLPVPVEDIIGMTALLFFHNVSLWTGTGGLSKNAIFGGQHFSVFFSFLFSLE
jgi:hypothetical protein